MLEPMLGYIDPVSGSMLLQIVIGALVGAGLFFRRSVFRFLGVFRRD